MTTSTPRSVPNLEPQLWSQAKAVFHDALERPDAQRDTFVRFACGDDDGLRRAVEALLDADRKMGSFLDSGRIGGRSADSLVIDPAVSTGADDVEVAALLKRRLRTIAIISGCANGFFQLLRMARLDMSPLLIQAIVLPGLAYLGAVALVAGALSRRRTHPLQALRRWEVALFGTTAAYYALETYTTLFFPQGWLVTYVARHPSELSILARQPAIIWIVVIVSYGMFVPNTLRRCAIATSLIASTPLIVIAAAGWRYAIPFKALELFLAEMTMWLTIGVALAVYGSHKIAVLQSEAMAARKLGQYQLKQRLGSGGMGEVYLAEHVLLKRPCAVKIIRADSTRDLLTTQRFLREVQITSTLTHPNTVQVFDYGQTPDGLLFFVMEYLSGLSLEDLIGRHGPLPESRASGLLRQLCAALAEAHGRGLVHRDIKPGNVILCERGGVFDVVKLLDFGLAREITADATSAGLTMPGAIFGTPAFMSPEQARGAKDVDARSDIYSLGALGHFLLTGQPPFSRASVVETLAAHITQPAPSARALRSDLSPDLEAVIARCLMKSPADRFQDVRGLDAALMATPGAWSEEDAADWWRDNPLSARARVGEPAGQ